MRTIVFSLLLATLKFELICVLTNFCLAHVLKAFYLLLDWLAFFKKVCLLHHFNDPLYIRLLGICPLR